MKTVTKVIQLFEKGDVIRIKKGITETLSAHGMYRAGMVGLVESVDKEELQVQFSGVDELYSVEASECDYIKPEQVKKLELPIFLSVKSLEPRIVINNKNSTVFVGCQKITFSDALKIADFIKTNIKLSAGRPKKVAKKKK